MPKYTATMSIETGRGESLTATRTGDYDEIFNVRQEVDNSNTFVDLISASATKGTSTLNDCKSLIIKNPSDVAVEVQIKTKEWTDGTPDANGGDDSLQLIPLNAGEFMYLPSFRQVNFQADANSGGTAYQLTNQVPDANMYVAVNNPAGGDAQLLDESGNITNSVTNFTVDDGDFFKAGDLIRLDNEIMEVTSVSGDELYVIRGKHGSAKATHNDDVALRFPFFNAYADFDKYSVAQTDTSGRFKCTNFFGYGRTEGEADGIVPGSFSMKFYEAGYQEFGLSGVNLNTRTGLAASTTYGFDIAVDGGSDYSLTFTTDATNGSFGGTNGLLQKIQEKFDAQYYTTSSNLMKKRVFINLVDGDVRITSGQHLSTSAISITAPASATTIFGVGAFNMAVGDIEAPVAARLPDDTIIDVKTGISKPNKTAFAYDDGHGNIKGKCSGTISYDSGKIDINNAPANAQFVVDANYGSAHSGGNDFGASTANCLLSIGARCCNSKIDATVEVIGLK